MFGTTAINAAETSYSLFWGGANSHGILYGRGNENAISRAMSGPAKRALRAVMTTLNGTAAGSTATATHAQVSSPAGLTESDKLGGSRTIDTITDISRATTAADATYIASLLTRISAAAPGTYPTDASGNGGGGKLNF